MKHPGFRIKIKDLKDLYYDFLSEGDTDEYVLGSLLLKNRPFDCMEVLGNKTKNYFSIAFSLEATRKDYNYWFFEELQIPIKFLAASGEYKLQAGQTKDLIIVLDENDAAEMCIENYYGTIFISFGFEKTPAKKIININNFQSQLLKISNLVQQVVVGICRAQNIRVPKETLMLVSQSEAISAYDKNSTDQQPSSATQIKKKTSVILPIEKPKHGFDFIGGQAKAKSELQAIAESMKHPSVYQDWGTRPIKGILLEGPSGTGKTILAGALANAVEANFYNIKTSEIFTMWYGESANNIQKIFDAAKEAIKSSGKPSILFFDEVDALTGSRDHMHEESQRVINVILTNLDGLEPSVGLTVVTATNRLDAIDSTFLRPGRIDRIVQVPLPDAQGRRDIFSIHINACEATAQRTLFDVASFDWPLISEKTEDISGAEIAEIVRRVLEAKAREEIYTGSRPKLADNCDLLQQIKFYEKRSNGKTIGFV
ncbi:hypothetical protein COT94_04015 [Candidatus Falkowbacteria bacterium CG10_big_fil_rev_8_21_14_0_10_37_14]|uniref:AAA+ ATPase domain-containing protein n=1 Tax=Candidatus Falkowbacteria bacterium CG10_big_fil_rev_8_21_14_0_10_37_14 TaxID=1974561 RepID=A0A2M6WSK4_9BACT|nr:ATP-binding protein [Candidatus Falkowbacteria bacterium]PIT95725.1 MAG: hypothetical protein COT94_04015 [Candidatus Falkowbacteria bacterium CG10_big_fil_rev_8_21_14_0_10_37_14]